MNIRKLSESDYNQLPADKRPVCKLTGVPLSHSQFKNNGRFAQTIFKKLWKKHSGDIDAINAVLSTMLVCPITGGYYPDLARWRGGTSKLGLSEEQQEDAYTSVLQQDTQCKFPGCCKTVPFSMLKWGTCCVTHHNQNTRIRRGDYKLEDLVFECKVDGMKFVRQEDVGDYLCKMHNYTKADIEAYFRKYHMKEGDDTCRQCGKPTTFQGIGNGYSSFCHNTDCNVLWYNEHTDRAGRAGPSIKKAMSSGDCVPSQLGYWIKQGYTQEAAERKLKDRQTTNSVDAIARREGCTKDEAILKRKEITRKWSDKVHTGQNWSKASQNLFWAVVDQLALDPEDTWFATYDRGTYQEDKNLEYRLETENSYCMPDFFIKSANVVIEFDGEYYHGAAGWVRGRTDEQRDADILKKHPNMNILHIGERDFLSDPKECVKICVEFIEQCKTGK